MAPTIEAVLLANGRIIDPAAGIDAEGSVLLTDGVVAGVWLNKDLPDALPGGCRTVDASGKWILPGLIDMHVHLREPGEEYKETIVSGTRAAAAGGFAGVACMPNTRPVNDNEAVTSLILARAAHAATRVYPVGAVSVQSQGRELAPLGELKQAGVVAVTDDGHPVADSQLMRRALEYADGLDLLVISHAEELSLSKNGVMNEGPLATRLGLRGIPRVAEEVMIYRDLALASFTGSRVHIAHVSTRESVDLIRRAKDRGVRVTAETAPHYFSLTEEAVGRYDTRAKMNPPLRTADDVEAIREGLADGTIDAIATDHAPHSREEKEVEFALAANGIIGLETALPLTLELVRQGVITPPQLVRLMSWQPACILGVPGGTLSPGSPADVTVVDPDLTEKYTEDKVVSKSRNSPFLGMELTGWPVMTFVGGRLVFERKES